LSTISPSFGVPPFYIASTYFYVLSLPHRRSP
jgi:hypothetical protein